MKTRAAGARAAHRGGPLVVAACLALACTFAERASYAGFPSIGCVTVPTHINLVGISASGIDPLGDFEVTVRDIGCIPIANSVVMVELQMGGDERLGNAPVAPGAIVDCPTNTVRAITGIDGKAHFRIPGGSHAGPAATLGANVRIYADALLLASIGAGAFDLDGANGLGGADLALWLDDFGSAANPTRSDYDGNLNVGGADLALWITAYGAGGSSQSATSFCP